MNSAHRWTVVLIATMGITCAAGCGHPPPPPPNLPAASRAPGSNPPAARPGPSGTIGSHNISAFSLFGGVTVRTAVESCAGKAQLQQGSAVVSDNCFTGDTNIVVCTDTTAPNPVMCAPHKGELAIAGGANDVVSYARVQ